METFPLNNLAEKFEVDRSVMVKAMRGVPADLVKRGNRPNWKVSTAAKAFYVIGGDMDAPHDPTGDERGQEAARGA